MAGTTHWSWTLKRPICFEGGGSRFVLHVLAQSPSLLDISCSSICHGPVMEEAGLTSFTKLAVARPLPTDAQSRCARQACSIAVERRGA